MDHIRVAQVVKPILIEDLGPNIEPDNSPNFSSCVARGSQGRHITDYRSQHGSPALGHLELMDLGESLRISRGTSTIPPIITEKFSDQV